MRDITRPLTLFGTCRPFRGEIGVMQMNALLTWSQLGAPILVLGDEEGAAEAAATIGARHIPRIERDATGLPTVRGLFDAAEAHSDTPCLAYVNTDILLTPALIPAVSRALAAASDAPVLATTRRRNIPAHRPLPDDADARLDAIAALDARYGGWNAGTAVDIFAYPRGLFDAIPDLVIGRMHWDHWLLWKARDRGASVVDVSPDAPVYHPVHGYGGQAKGWGEVTQSAEAARNRSLINGHALTLDQAMTHCLKDGAVIRLTDAGRAALIAASAPDPARHMAAGLAYLRDGLDARPLGETIDGCRVLLDRFGHFVSRDDDALPAPDAVADALTRAQRALDAGDADAAACMIQDLVCAGFADRLQTAVAAGRRVYVWGGGGAGGWAAALLRRAGVELAGVADSDPTLVGATRHAAPVVASDWASLRAHDPSAYVVIASMYAREIATMLTAAGARPGGDFTA